MYVFSEQWKAHVVNLIRICKEDLVKTQVIPIIRAIQLQRSSEKISDEDKESVKLHNNNDTSDDFIVAHNIKPLNNNETFQCGSGSHKGEKKTYGKTREKKHKPSSP